MVGDRRVDPVRTQVAVRSTGREPPALVPPRAIQPEQRHVLLRGVRVRYPEVDGLLSGGLAVVRHARRGHPARAPARVPVLVGLRLRSRRSGGPPDRRGQLPERLPAPGPVHHGPERDGGNRPPRDPAPRGRLRGEQQELPPGRNGRLGVRGSLVRRRPQRVPPPGRLRLGRPVGPDHVRAVGPGSPADERRVCLPDEPDRRPLDGEQRRVIVSRYPRRHRMEHRILRGGFAALPHQRVEHGHLLRAGETRGPPRPEPPRWPRLADRLLPNLREYAERPEHPATARAAGRPGFEHDNRVPAGLLQLHVLPGVHRLRAEGPELDGHGNPRVQHGPAGGSARPGVEPRPLAGRLPHRVLQPVHRPREPHDGVAGDELRPSAEKTIADRGRDHQRGRGP